MGEPGESWWSSILSLVLVLRLAKKRIMSETITPEKARDLLFREEAPPLHGQTAPQYAICRETPESRKILYLKAQGLSNEEIARRTGYSVWWLRQIVRQPWFQRNMVKLLHAVGVDGVEKAIKVNAVDALTVAVDVMNSTQSETLRAKCAFEILKLSQGSKVTVRTENIPASQLDSQISQIQNELAALEKGKN